MQTKQASDIATDDKLKEELALFRVLRPYIGHCLALNHDINNSLAGIIGFAELMLSEADQLSESQRESVQQILQCAERIQREVMGLGDEKIALAEKVDLNLLSGLYRKKTEKSD
ncbi:MAG: hypothetical protein KAU35_08370 [candidate division Zixibacteria bacterium]|nr:hypothetical protein [candidate division Zixibacteria bacterium]